MHDPHNRRPSGAWEQVKRADRAVMTYVWGISAVPVVILGITAIFGAHGDAFTLGLGLVFLAAGVSAGYDTAKKLGWIDRIKANLRN
jgi:hypothetical protein